MHEFILGIFRFIKSFLYLLRIICVFLILMLLLYWIQNLTNAHWEWMSFIKPFLDGLLAAANQIYSLSFDFFGAKFELKYASSLIILIAASLFLKLVSFGVEVIESLYKGARFVCKKSEETIVNKVLKDNITREEMKISKYSVVIHTQIKKKFSHAEISINIEEQNKMLNDFMIKKTLVKPEEYKGGFLYQFENFDKIDTVLDAVFKLVNSSAPIEPAVCIQVEGDMQKLDKLIDLKYFGKVIMAADTRYRYKFNETHRYQTSQVGIFQYGDGTIEVHEFKEIL